MSGTVVIRTSSILICFIIFAAMAFAVFAEDLPAGRQDATSGATRKPTAIQQKINVRQDKVDNRIAALQEKQASKTAALKAKLQAFKDQKKAEIADRVNTNLNKINQNQTAQMEKNLSNISTILDRLEARVNKGAPDIKDPDAAKAAIASARNNIATTSAAVQAQAEKDYTIQVSSEGRIRVDAKTQRDKLHVDLLTLRKKVVDAKQSVANAIRVAKSGPAPAGAGLKEGTASGK